MRTLETIVVVDADHKATIEFPHDIPVGNQPAGVAVSACCVWIANTLDNTVTRLNASTGTKLGKPISVPENPFAITANGDEVWVTSLGAGRVTRIAP